MVAQRPGHCRVKTPWEGDRPMKRDEQHKMVQAVREHTGKMTQKEKDEFAVLLKRDRDDEDLEAESLQRLISLHRKYVEKRTREDLEDRWKKLTGNQ